MKIMVYSQIGRVVVRAAQTMFQDLLGSAGAATPIDDNLLRRVRHRLLMQENPRAPVSVLGSKDFSTLAGTRDMLLHSHEDPLSLDRRIERGALDRMGLRLLSFVLPTPAHRARYHALSLEDPLRRDFAQLVRSVSAGLGPEYTFWVS